MRNRTLIALAAAAALLAALIVVVERGALEGGDRRRRGQRLLAGLDADRVTRLRIERRDTAPIELHRGAKGGWRLDGSLPAAAAVVQQLLSALEFVEVLRPLPPETAPGQLGLRPPRIGIVVWQGGDEAPLRLGIGVATAGGRGAYVAQGARLLVVPRSFAALFDLDRTTLRRRDLVPAATIAEVERVAFAGGGKRLELRRVAGRWWVEHDGRRLRADPARVARIASALVRLRARRFVAARVAAENAISVAVDARGGAARLRIAGKCPGRGGGRLVAAADGARWLSCCVDAGDLEPLVPLPAWDELVDRALTRVGAAALTAVTVSRGAAMLVKLRREDARWRIAGPGAGGTADHETVRRWVARLAAARGKLRPAREAALARQPLPLLVVLAGQGRQERLRFGRLKDQRLLAARRGDEPALLLLPSSFSSALDVTPRRFGDRTVVELDRHALVAVTTRRPGLPPEVLERGADGAWRVTAPRRAPADPGHVERLLTALARLRALRPLPAEGAALVRGTRLELASVRQDLARGERRRTTVRLVIAPAPDDRPCRAEGGRRPTARFELPARLCRLLVAYRAARAPLTIERARLRRIEIRGRGAQALVLERRGGSWQRGKQPVEAALVEELVAWLAGWRATVGGYGAVGGAGAPAGLVIVIEQRGRGRQELRIDGQRRAWRAGGAVWYRCAAEDLRRLAALRGKLEPGRGR